MITLFGWPPAFGCLGPSPFVLKSMIQLDLLGVAYKMGMADLEQAPYARAPYVQDGEELIGDSNLIRRHFEKKLGKDLDDGLSAEQRASAWAMDRMIETQMGPALLYYRWLIPANFEKGPKQFFMQIPEEQRQTVIDDMLGKMGAGLKLVGIFGTDEDNFLWFVEKAIEAVAQQLGQQPFMMGDSPTAIDAAVFGFVHSYNSNVFDAPLAGMIEKHPNLVAHSQRIEEQFFTQPKWDM